VYVHQYIYALILTTGRIHNFPAAREDKPTKAKLVRALKSISKWKELANIFSTKDVRDRVKDMLDEVADLVNNLGGSVKRSDGKSRGTPFQSRVAI
jgi:hypothetical protein